MDKLPNFTKKNFHAISITVDKGYDNFILEKVNDHCLRMAVMEGEYRWHYHSCTDELFIVLEGELKIEIKGEKPVFLHPGEYITIPKQTVHKTCGVSRTVNLTFERNGADTIFID